MENGWQLVFRDHFVELIGHPIVGKETLHRRMKLEAFDHSGLDQIARFTHAHAALVWIDRGEGHHDIAVCGGGVGNLLVGNALGADLEFAIDGEHDEADLALAIVGDRLGNGWSLADFEIFARRLVIGPPHLVMRLAAGHFGVGVNVDGDEISDVHADTPARALDDRSKQ